MPNWTSEQYEAHLAKRAVSNSKPKQAEQNALGSEIQGEQKGRPRVIVRFTAFRRRLLDQTNLEGGIKYIEDSLVHSRIISGDTIDEIERTVTQQVCRKGEERTEIEIIWP